MDKLVSTLVQKRRGVKEIGMSTRLLGKLHSFHAAAIFPHGKPCYILSYGENQPRKIRHTVHAEANAIEKLYVDFSRSKKRMKIIDILVIRTSKTGCIGNSKPCFDCVKYMYYTPPKKGYEIRDVYYSNARGEIVCERLIDLVIEALSHSIHVIL